jgi:hypothetical protein
MALSVRLAANGVSVGKKQIAELRFLKNPYEVSFFSSTSRLRPYGSVDPWGVFDRQVGIRMTIEK